MEKESSGQKKGVSHFVGGTVTVPPSYTTVYHRPNKPQQ